MSLSSYGAHAYQEFDADKRNQVILDHLPQIKFIAQRIALRLPPEIQLDDLISAGIIGLLDAYEKFDANEGVEFKTYADFRIRGAILDSLRGLDWAPRSLRKQSREVEHAYARLEQELGRAASDEEVAAELNMELGAYHTLLNQLNGLMIGHFAASEADAGITEDDLPLEYSPISASDSPFESVRKQEMREIIAGIIERLPEREQLVLSLYYREELTMKEIGQVLGVNESRVSQLHTRAVLRLRGKLSAALKPRKMR
jgi:RNA polymerase sigma factor for flagellar operon FliA